MPTCVLCGSETFDEFDGHFFCESCGTQSQVCYKQLIHKSKFDFKSLKSRYTKVQDTILIRELLLLTLMLLSMYLVARCVDELTLLC